MVWEQTGQQFPGDGVIPLLHSAQSVSMSVVLPGPSRKILQPQAAQWGG
jgi:hypothetical protein